LFDELLDTVMEATAPNRDDVALDLGAGTGFLAIPLAERVGRTYAVDHSPAMLRLLAEHVAASGVHVWAAGRDLRRFVPPEPVDIVVSNYALHHLSHSAKADLVAACYDWMEPAGRICIADMMVPLTLRPGQSGPLLRKLRTFAGRGVGGYWRIAKNGARWVSGRGEYPASLPFWRRALGEAGFEDVDGRTVGAESGVVWGRKAPDAGASTLLGANVSPRRVA
jgi:ubiquinone/menaquinone biosynthesis C-methylase UbiE